MTKKLLLIIFFNLLANTGLFAHTGENIFETVEKIKLLQSNRNDVKSILADYELEDDEDLYHQSFSKDDNTIEVYYSKGTCHESDDEDEAEDAELWNAAEGTVIKVEIDLDESVNIEKLQYNLSDFKKEQVYNNDSDHFVYFNKKSGIAFSTFEDETDSISFIPPKDHYSMLCSNKAAKKFAHRDSWFKVELKDRNMIIEYGSANVTELILSESEITGNEISKETGSSAIISVKTTAIDPEADVLIYEYKVSGGSVIGTGAEVLWDLTGVKPGTYTITAGVDDGCGVCGQTVTKEIVVRKRFKYSPESLTNENESRGKTRYDDKIT